MVKKQLANGDPCEKCAQTEEMLRRRGLWDHIDDVVWAVEGDAESPGNLIGARHGVKVAPFFVLRDDDGAEVVFTSPLKMIREHFPSASSTRSVAQAGATSRPADEASDLATLRDRLEDAAPEEILRFALERFGDRCKLAFSGGDEIVLIDMATRLDLPLRIFTLDTGRLHGETHEFIDEVRRRYGVEIETYLPDAAELSEFVRRSGMNSFLRDGHRACCAIRRIGPLARALDGCEAWLTGRRRDQPGAARAELPVLSVDARLTGTRRDLVSVNPLARWTREHVRDYARRHDVPTHPLYEQGYTSIGCEPCTRPVPSDQPERAGRWWWEDEGDRESGLHLGGDGI